MMNKIDIEARDRDLVKKFRGIVEKKEEVKFQTPRRNPSWPVFIISGTIMMAAIIFMVSNMIPDPVLTEPATATIQPPKESVQSVLPENPAPSEEYIYSDVEKLDLPHKEVVEPVEETADTAPSPDGVQVNAEVPMPPQNVPAEAKIPEPVVGDGIIIDGLVPCLGVKDRQFVSPQTVFVLKDVIKPTVWMNVLTDHSPLTLNHVYYLNGVKFCTVPLKIPYPRTRTWSHVTLSKPEHAGLWRVDIVNEKGKVLGRTEFTVVP